MCDIYTDYCANCKRPIPMHLGDFMTQRYEIQVFCWNCWSIVRHKYKDKRYVIWRIEDANEAIKKDMPDWYERQKEFIGKFIVVVALTDNAWENRRINHPNLFLQMEMEDPAVWSSICNPKETVKAISEITEALMVYKEQLHSLEKRVRNLENKIMKNQNKEASKE